MRWIALVAALATLAAATPALATCIAKGEADHNSRSIVLPGLNFRDRDLSGLDLTELRRDGADFTGANLTGTFMWGSVVRYSTFTDANLTKARLGGMLATDAVMIRANFTNVIAGGNGFSGVDASGATFVCAEFMSSKFDKAIFIYANFTDANLYGTTAVATDFTGANFTRTSLRATDLSKAVLRNANLTKANLTNATLAGANLTGATLTGATLTGATLTDANWVDGTTRCGAGSIGYCAPTTVTGAPDMAAATIRPRTGMWRSAEGGTGYLFEVDGTGLRLVVIGFDGQGAPSWSIAEGRIGRDNVFTADLKRCTGAGTGPADCGTDLGPIAVSFDSATSASLLGPSAAAVRIMPATRN